MNFVCPTAFNAVICKLCDIYLPKRSINTKRKQQKFLVMVKNTTYILEYRAKSHLHTRISHRPQRPPSWNSMWGARIQLQQQPLVSLNPLVFCQDGWRKRLFVLWRRRDVRKKYQWIWRGRWRVRFSAFR